MVMKVLRDTASGGIGKFILFGFLVLAVAGLALMDIGGFFRGGTGSNNVIKIDGQSVSIGQFDREVRRQLAQIGIAPQDAYKMGYMNQIVAGEIRKILLDKKAREAGILISHDRIAAHIASLLKPLSSTENKPADVLRQILRNQGMTEQQFQKAINHEMQTTLLEDALGAGAATISEPLIDGLYQFQKETRDIEYLKFHDTEIDVAAPAEEEIQRYYDALRETYKIPETRAVTIMLLDDSAIVKDTSLDATAILDKKFELIEKLEDLAATDLSAEDIAKEVPLTIITVPQIGASGQVLGDDEVSMPDVIRQNLPTLAEEAFALDIGETSMALEFEGARFAAVRVTSIQPQDYHPLDKVKTQLIERWKKERQHTQTQERAMAVMNDLKESGQSFKAYADANKRTYRTAETLHRGQAQPPFSAAAVDTAFAATPGEYVTSTIEGGVTLINVTAVHLPNITESVRQSDDYQALFNAIEESAANEAIGTILEAEHAKKPALINYDLLERVYGENSQYY